MAVRDRRFALMEGIVAGVLFGTAAVLIRLAGNMNALSVALWRLLIASAVLALGMGALKGRWSASWIRTDFKRILILGFLLGTHFLLFVSAVRETTILNATVLVNTTPIFSMIISTLVYGANPSKLALVGMLVSFIGASIIAYGDATSANPGSLIGDVEAISAAVAWGFYLNYGKEKRRQLPLVPTMIFVYLMAALTIGVVITSSSTTLAIPHSSALLLAMIGLGVLPTAVAHTLFFSSLSGLQSFEAATMALLEPLGATLLGVIVLAEVPTPAFVVGGAFVLAGIVAVAAQM